MNEHITMFNQLVVDLLNLDVKFEDEDLALILLSSLPDEFEHLETMLLPRVAEIRGLRVGLGRTTGVSNQGA